MWRRCGVGVAITSIYDVGASENAGSFLPCSCSTSTLLRRLTAKSKKTIALSSLRSIHLVLGKPRFNLAADYTH